jgi:hypothetical protein
MQCRDVACYVSTCIIIVFFPNFKFLMKVLLTGPEAAYDFYMKRRIFSKLNSEVKNYSQEFIKNMSLLLPILKLLLI